MTDEVIRDSVRDAVAMWEEHHPDKILLSVMTVLILRDGDGVHSIVSTIDTVEDEDA